MDHFGSANIRGVLGRTFRIADRLIKTASGLFQFRDDRDTTYVRVQAADPVVDDDLVTKRYCDSHSSVAHHILSSTHTDTSTSPAPTLNDVLRWNGAAWNASPDNSVPAFVVPFSVLDIGVPVLIGTVPRGVCVESCVVIIETVFNDPATLITVGDMAAHGRFQAATDNIPTFLGDYDVPSNYAYGASTGVYLFVLGTATIGSGRVILYL